MTYVLKEMAWILLTWVWLGKLMRHMTPSAMIKNWLGVVFKDTLQTSQSKMLRLHLQSTSTISKCWWLLGSYQKPEFLSWQATCTVKLGPTCTIKGVSMISQIHGTVVPNVPILNAFLTWKQLSLKFALNAKNLQSWRGNKLNFTCYTKIEVIMQCTAANMKRFHSSPSGLPTFSVGKCTASVKTHVDSQNTGETGVDDPRFCTKMVGLDLPAISHLTVGK